MKFISWNVNGIRACVTKGFLDYFKEVDADIFCLQETKLQEGQIDLNLEGYYEYWNYAQKKGYSGTAIFTKKKPISVAYGIDIEEHDNEGRVITLEFEDFYFITVYTPNSQSELKRLDYRMKWEDDFRGYLKGLEAAKPVIVTGDMNVAHREIDLKNPKTNRNNAGFTDQEREKMTVLLSSGFLFYALLSLSMYPVLFKLGYQKGKIWGFYIPAALTTLIYIIVLEYDIYTEGFLTNLLSYASDHLLTAVSMIIGLGAGILAISCLLSIKTYSRRDF